MTVICSHPDALFSLGGVRAAISPCDVRSPLWVVLRRLVLGGAMPIDCRPAESLRSGAVVVGYSEKWWQKPEGDVGNWGPTCISEAFLIQLVTSR